MDSCHGEVDMNIHKAGMLRFVTINLQLVVRSTSSRPEASREKVLLSENVQIKIILCLITIWSIGIDRRGLNELIFWKPQIRPKLTFFISFACSSKLVRATSDSFCQHGSQMIVHKIVPKAEKCCEIMPICKVCWTCVDVSFVVFRHCSVSRKQPLRWIKKSF